MRLLAAQLPEEVLDGVSAQEFDAYMFHGGDYFVEKYRGYPGVLIGVVLAMGVGVVTWALAVAFLV